MEQDRRKHKRYTPDEYLSVYEFYTGRYLGGLANLSTEGAMLFTSEPISVSTFLRCRVELTSQILGRDDIVFDAECRWCRKNVKEDRWESGYALTVTGIDAELISYLVLGFKFRDWGDQNVPDVKTVELESRRRAVRYDLKKPLPVFEFRGYREVGTMEDLSVGGMRMISHSAAERGDVLHCRIKLPGRIFQQEYLIVEATCMWCRRIKGLIKYEIGYCFNHVSERDAAIILHLLIHHTDKQSSKKRLQVIK